MVNVTVNTCTVQAGNTEDGNLALPALGQKEDPQEDNCLVDTDSSMSKDTEVKYHEVLFELQVNCNWSIKGKASMARYKTGDVEWEEIPHRINK